MRYAKTFVDGEQSMTTEPARTISEAPRRSFRPGSNDVGILLSRALKRIDHAVMVLRRPIEDSRRVLVLDAIDRSREAYARARLAVLMIDVAASTHAQEALDHAEIADAHAAGGWLDPVTAFARSTGK